MRVLHVYRTYFPDSRGGLEQTIRQISLATSKHGIANRVFTLSGAARAEPLERTECTVYQSQLHLEIASCGISLTCWRRFSELYRWADIVHYHFPWPFADLLETFAAANKAVVVTYHSDIVRQRLLKAVYGPLMNRFLNAADAIVATSPNYLATSETLRRFADKTSIIPIGLDPETYPETKAGAELAGKYGNDYYLFVGVFRYYKGLHILLEAVADAPYDVVIVGTGPIEPDLKRQASSLGLTNVSFAGPVSDATKIDLLKGCKGIVFPSYLRAEAFGVTLLEGAMFSKPLISTEVGTGTSHVNLNMQTGLVVEPGSPTALRDAMDKLHSDPQLATRLGRNARHRFDDNFTAKRMGERYVELYQKLLNGPETANAAHCAAAVTRRKACN